MPRVVDRPAGRYNEAMWSRVRSLLPVLGAAVAGVCWVAPAAGGVLGSEPFSGLGEMVHRHGLWVGMLATFVGGIALNLTPCVYPMIPVTLGFFSGQASGAKGRVLFLAVCYVLGISFNYALLGVLAARTGALFGSWLQQPPVLLGISAIMVALALSMFGLYELRPPRAVTRRLGQAPAGYGGAFVLGLIVGLVASPCIGPFVVGLLVVVGQLANPVAGFFLFLALGLGMGLPYLLLGLAAHRISHLPKAGPWLLWCKQLLGLVLIGAALYFLGPLLSARGKILSLAGFLLGSGVYLGWVARVASAGRRFLRVRRLAGVILVAAALLVGWPRPAPRPAVAWVPYSPAALEQARRSGRPTLVDVYADWCLPCVEMDHVTFRNAQVVQALTQVNTLRVDVTREIGPEAQALLETYRIYGAPTLLAFDRAGRERRELRQAGLLKADALLQLLQRLQEADRPAVEPGK